MKHRQLFDELYSPSFGDTNLTKLPGCRCHLFSERDLLREDTANFELANYSFVMIDCNGQSDRKKRIDKQLKDHEKETENKSPVVLTSVAWKGKPVPRAKRKIEKW